jgi:hypothetical protein
VQLAWSLSTTAAYNDIFLFTHFGWSRMGLVEDTWKPSASLATVLVILGPTMNRDFRTSSLLYTFLNI